MKHISLFFLLLSLTAYGMQNNQTHDAQLSDSSGNNFLTLAHSFAKLLDRSTHASDADEIPIQQTDADANEWTPFYKGADGVIWSVQYAPKSEPTSTKTPVEPDAEDEFASLREFLSLRSSNPTSKK